MIILPERALPRGRILLPQKPQEWRQPSQRTGLFQIENRTRFRLTARLDDGHVAWRGWFDDREDADAFLHSLISGSLVYERELWRLPTPWWDNAYADLHYDFVTTRTLTSTSGANQTDTTPNDWNSTNNTIELIASGGSGGVATSSGAASGGGGAGYSKITNQSLSPGGSVTFHLEAGAVGSSVTNGTSSGVAGGDCWYNGTTLAGSSVGAKGGGAGNAGIISNPVGGAGGLASGGIGPVRKSGGSGGNVTSNAFDVCTGGGGAGGPNGDGNTAVSNGSSNSATAGATGDAGLGGTGSAGVFNGNSSNGNNGTEFGATGSGGGSGGAADNAGVVRTTGSGGLYGAGGGGNQTTDAVTSHTSGAGGQAIIFITYEALFVAEILTRFPDKPYRKIRMVPY